MWCYSNIIVNRSKAKGVFSSIPENKASILHASQRKIYRRQEIERYCHNFVIFGKNLNGAVLFS